MGAGEDMIDAHIDRLLSAGDDAADYEMAVEELNEFLAAHGLTATDAQHQEMLRRMTGMQSFGDDEMMRAWRRTLNPDKRSRSQKKRDKLKEKSRAS